MNQEVNSSEKIARSPAGWRICVIGFITFASFDTYLLFRLFEYCKSNPNMTLFYLPLIPSLVYLLAMPMYLTLHRRKWSVGATILASVAGVITQLIVIIAVIIPSYI
jgi:hypothetical protein